MSHFDEDENSLFYTQQTPNAILEISELLGIDSKNVSYDSRLKVFFIGLDGALNKLDIHKIDDEIFESRAIAFKNCHFHCKIKLDNRDFTHRVVFMDCIFYEKIIFNNSTFNEPLDIVDCVFHKDLSSFSARFKSFVTIRASKTSKDTRMTFDSSYFFRDLRVSGIFDCSFDLSNTNFESDIYFSEPYGEIAVRKMTYFKNFAYLSNIVSKGKFHLNDCNFEYLSIQNTKGNHIILDHSVLNSSNFCDSSFEKFSLVNARFLTFPLMLGCIFEQEINLTNANFPISFEDIVKSASYFDEEKNRYENKTLFPEYIEEYSIIDFFAKNRDIFRKMKYLLLKENNNLDASAYHRAELYCKELELDSNTKKSPREWIDWAQLFFYRNTSDHHTDTLKSFHTLIALIGVFGLLCGAIVLGFDYFAFDYKGRMDVFSLKETYFSHIKTSIQNHTLEYFLGNLALVFVFIGLFLGVVWECSRDILIALGYVMTLSFLATSPKYLIPAMSLFGEGKAMLDPLGIVGGVYTLLFGLIAYSLIKTARKNSIIPS